MFFDRYSKHATGLNRPQMLLAVLQHLDVQTLKFYVIIALYLRKTVLNFLNELYLQ